MPVNIPSAELKKLVKLAERKEALMAQIQEIDRDMLRLERQFGQASAGAGHQGRLIFSITTQNKGGGVRRSRSRVQRRKTFARGRKD
jgi:hypothetical protein